MDPNHRKLLAEAQAHDRAQNSRQAVETYRQFLLLEPTHSDAWSSLAGHLLALGDPGEARIAASKAVQLSPQHLSARVNLGRALMRVQLLDDAEIQFLEVMKQDPSRMDAPLFLAECKLHRRDLPRAGIALKRADTLAAEPGRAPALLTHLAELWAIYSMGLADEHKVGEAEAACHAALRLRPQNLHAASSLANLRMSQGKLEEAENRLRGLVLTHPQNVDLRQQLIRCLTQRQEFIAADREIALLIAGHPGSLSVHRGILGTHYAFGRWREHASEIERFRILEPTSPYPDFHQSFADLLFGDFSGGWRRHEARFQIPKDDWPAYRCYAQPTWEGRSFAGRTLYVWSEQGFGDTMMFLRYLPQVKALGGRVVLEVHPPLLDLATTCAGVDLVVPLGGGWTEFDLQISLQSLPWIFHTEVATIPAEVPYLRPPATVPHRADLQEQLALAQEQVRIGLVWAGSPLHARDAERSLPADALAPLAALPGVTWYSLQQRREELPPLPNLISLAHLMTNFSDTAFVLSELDLLITVDTAVAHLAGALGVPTLLLLTYQPDYRWLLERSDSPWYPTFHLYRQPSYGDWTSVIHTVLEDLSTGA